MCTENKKKDRKQIYSLEATPRKDESVSTEMKKRGYEQEKDKGKE